MSSKPSPAASYMGQATDISLEPWHDPMANKETEEDRDKKILWGHLGDVERPLRMRMGWKRSLQMERMAASRTSSRRAKGRAKKTEVAVEMNCWVAS